ncbi:LysR family transcriptional regulator, partial [Bacillus sp. AFS001701]|uniref:LysR family transcriptional regulator substrate-binding protein n=1 Tax=Bacillus sp. AFS001701 TaxID=2033480 RepID=UPI000BFACEF0
TNIPLYTEEFYLAVPFDHHLAEREKVDLEEIKDIQLVLRPKNHNCRKLFDDAATSMGFVFKPIIELTDVNSILSIVKAGIGATILPNTLLASENAETFKVIKIVNPAISKEIAIVHHKEKYIGSAARNFIDLLVAYVNLTSLYVGGTENTLINL